VTAKAAHIGRIIVSLPTDAVGPAGALCEPHDVQHEIRSSAPRRITKQTVAL
jgi:hypothetical protein